MRCSSPARRTAGPRGLQHRGRGVQAKQARAWDRRGRWRSDCGPCRSRFRPDSGRASSAKLRDQPVAPEKIIFPREIIDIALTPVDPVHQPGMVCGSGERAARIDMKAAIDGGAVLGMQHPALPLMIEPGRQKVGGQSFCGRGTGLAGGAEDHPGVAGMRRCGRSRSTARRAAPGSSSPAHPAAHSGGATAPAGVFRKSSREA